MTADTLLHWLLRTSVEASVLILAVLALRFLLGTRLKPSWRIGLWMIVGAKLMLPAFIPAGFGLGTLWENPKDLDDRSDVIFTVPAVVLRATDPTRLPNGAVPAAAPEASFSILHSALAAWLIGVLAVLGIALFKQARFNRYLRGRPPADEPLLLSSATSLAQKAGLRQPVSIVLMPAGTTPAMVGIRQPKLLLPEDWSTRFDERGLKHVVLHELLHVKHHDLIWNWAATAIQALHWFNPLVWFVVSRFQADRELRCDAGALAVLAPAERLDYGRTLLRIQETFFAPPAIAGLAPCVRNHPALRQRILMIAAPTTRQPWLQALLVLTLGVLACYSFTTARAAEKEVPPKVRLNPEKDDSHPTPALNVRPIVQSSLPPGTKIENEVYGDNHIMIDGEAENLAAVIRLRDKLVNHPHLKGWSWEMPAPLSNPDGVIFRFEARPLIALDKDDDGKPASKRVSMRDEEGGKPSSERENGTKKPGTGDGEGSRKNGLRDGDKPRTGTRDGEKPRTGPRDGEDRPSAESGQKPRKSEGDRAATSSGKIITIHVPAAGDTVIINGEKRSTSGLRGFLSTFLPEHPGAKVIVSGDPDTPLKSLYQIVDAVRDNGNKNVGIKAE